MSGVVPGVRATVLASACALVLPLVTACAELDPADDAVGIVATGCPPGESHGSGVPIAPRLVLTAAHVVKGGGPIEVTNGSRSVTGEVVALDPTADLAIVEVEQPIGRTFDLYEGDPEAIATGSEGVAYVMRDDALVAIPVTVDRSINLRSENIYIEGMYDSPAWQLEADTVSGDSGGAVVVGGEVIGVLRFRSNGHDGRAYAVDPVRAGGVIREQLASGDLGDVDLARCHSA